MSSEISDPIRVLCRSGEVFDLFFLDPGAGNEVDLLLHELDQEYNTVAEFGTAVERVAATNYQTTRTDPVIDEIIEDYCARKARNEY